MTFEEIKIESSKVYAIIKIVILVSVFLVIAMNVLAAHAYEFVHCQNEVTGLTMTYPTGTICGGDGNNDDESDDDDGDDEATEQEEEAMKEAE